jgi:serine/threonine-protein kinase
MAMPDNPETAADRLAAEIADGTPIDWQAAAAERVEELFDELRIVAAIANVHREVSAEPGNAALAEWGHLTLLQKLGTGTSGEVFLAVDNRLHRDVALKLLFPGPDHDNLEARALAEGRLLARIRHPNVVTVFAVEQFGGRIGLITERIRGRTLAEHVDASGPVGPAECAQIGADVCCALAAVHEAGLLHRDIKAQNVMRQQNGRTVLMDFGAGLAPDGSPALAGTPLYLAPELLEGAPPTPASDIYSVGVMLHYLLTGRFPVAGVTIAEIRHAHRAGARSLLRHARRDVPRRLSQAIDTATDPDPARRHPTAAAFAEALARSRPILTHKRRLVLASAAIVAGATVWMALKGAPVPAMAVASDVASPVAIPAQYKFGGPSFDGRFLAHIDPQLKAWVTHTSTGHARSILEAQQGEGSPQWFILSPDGRRAAYVWHLPDGRIELRIKGIEERWPQAVQEGWPSVTILSTRAPAWIEPVPGEHGLTRTSPAWSPDGTLLAHVTIRGMNMYDFASQLTLRDAAGNVVRDLAPPLRWFYQGQVHWSPDGKTLLMRGKGIDGYWAYHSIDPATGAATAMVRGSAPGWETGMGHSPAWGADGRSLVWVHTDGRIVERVLSTGEERTLVRPVHGSRITGQAPAPRGRALAFTTAIGDMNITIDPGRIRVSLRPDGRALTYSSGTTAFEPWVMRGIAR